MKELLSVVCSDLSLPPPLSPHLFAQNQYLLTPIRQFPKAHLREIFNLFAFFNHVQNRTGPAFQLEASQSPS